MLCLVCIILSKNGSSLFCLSNEKKGSQGTVANMWDSGVSGWVELSWVGLGHVAVGLCRVIFSRCLLRFVFVLFCSFMCLWMFFFVWVCFFRLCESFVWGNPLVARRRFFGKRARGAVLVSSGPKCLVLDLFFSCPEAAFRCVPFCRVGFFFSSFLYSCCRVFMSSFVVTLLPLRKLFNSYPKRFVPKMCAES